MSEEKKARRKEKFDHRADVRVYIHTLQLERATAHLRPRGLGNFTFYEDAAVSGPNRARRRLRTSNPHFSRNRAEDTLLDR